MDVFIHACLLKFYCFDFCTVHMVEFAIQTNAYFVYIYIYMSIYICVYIYVCIYIYIYIYIYIERERERERESWRQALSYVMTSFLLGKTPSIGCGEWMVNIVVYFAVMPQNLAKYYKMPLMLVIIQARPPTDNLPRTAAAAFVCRFHLCCDTSAFVR